MRVSLSSRLQINDLILIIYPIVIFAKSLVEKHIPPLQNNSFLKSSVIFSGLLLGGIPQVIYNIRNRIVSNNQTTRTRKQATFAKSFRIMKELPTFGHTKRLFSFAVLIGLSLLSLFSIYPQFFISSQLEQPEKNCRSFLVLFSLFFAILYVKLLLHTDLFLHHYISFALLFIGCICLFINSIDINQIKYTVPYYLAISICYMFPYSYLKVIMLKKHIQPLLISMYYGLFGLIWIVVVYLICYLGNIQSTFTKDILDIGNALQEVFSNGKYFGLLLACLILQFFNAAGTFIIFYYYDPVVEQLIYYHSGILFWIYNSIESFDWTIFIISFIGAFCFLIGFFIYKEIIIIHICQIDKNTWEGINQRSNAEVNELVQLYVDEIEAEE